MQPISASYLQKNGVYFYIPDGPFDEHYLHYAAGCLASGLKELGVPVFSNLTDPLFKTKPLGDMGNHVYIFYITQRSYSADLINGIDQFVAPFKIILCMADTVDSMITPPRVPSLMAHENRFFKINGLRDPWAFGLSTERIKAAAGGKPATERENSILCNFRSSYHQGVRNLLEITLVPLLQEHQLVVDKENTEPEEYFEKLKRYAGCLAYGGDFSEDMSRRSCWREKPSVQFRLHHVNMTQPVVIQRWDSWRWWESLSAGCLTFHLDFEKYGFLLPVQPEPWVHYIPIDLSDLRGTVEKLMDSRAKWGEIAEQGRAWALNHYSPIAVAKRFLDYSLRRYGASRT